MKYLEDASKAVETVIARITGEQVVFVLVMVALFGLLLVFGHSAIRRQFLTEHGRTAWYTGPSTWVGILVLYLSLSVLCYICWFNLDGFGIRADVQHWLVRYGISISTS